LAGQGSAWPRLTQLRHRKTNIDPAPTRERGLGAPAKKDLTSAARHIPSTSLRNPGARANLAVVYFCARRRFGALLRGGLLLWYRHQTTWDSIMTARDTILNRLRGRNLETALEREFYTSQEDYQVDLDMIWYRDWLFVGHDCEVLNPGNYLTVQIGEYPVVVVRDRDGGLRAFHNTCRHRGSRICSAERGTAPRLVCPLPPMDLRTGWALDRSARHGRRVR
jgi:nitrite reductase/ring-hydroxylating ferredoxin subunit